MSVASSTVGNPPPPLVIPPRHRPRIVVSSRMVVSVLALTLCGSCRGGTTDVPEDTAEREAFIGAYLDLRTEALSTGSTELGNEVRDSILVVHDVTDQDLLDFIDMHGEDIEFMRDLWTEVEARLTQHLEQIVRDEADEGTDGTDRIEGADAGV